MSMNAAILQRSSLRKYGAVFSQGIQSAMEYRADFLFGLFNGCFSVFIQFFLWTAIYSGSQENNLYGYSYPQMVVYVIMAGIMLRIVSIDFHYDIAFDIKQGTLNRFLTQPISYFPYRVFDFIGRKIFQLGFIIVISAGVLIFTHFVFSAEFTLSNILFAVLVLPLSLFLNCMLFYCISMTAFWMTEAWGVFDGMGVVSTILSGGLFPLSVFGETAQEIFKYMPFQYVIYFPLRIICGNAQKEDIVFGICAQLIWILLLYILAKLLWRAGMKKYIAAGG
ncbi:MAG: ABC-2 family transporter protein [Treponema sp.]|nr:ABC-2 family transporter protein [Treponema sp.]MCL2251736.1 ABC-2 family transporter protein [Treponema sp.]